MASIYGCLGRSSRVTAAITTNGIRRSILEAAQYAANLGYTVYYIDTDSLFIKHPTRTQDVSPELNARFPHTEIERKIYKRCMFVQKKIYYTVSEGELRYTQNVNGSLAWKEFINYIYQQSHIKSNQDVYRVFVSFFEKIYDRLLGFGSVTTELLDMITKEVKLAASYKTANERSKLKDFLRVNYPTMAANYRQTVYYQFNRDVKSADLIPSVHLKSIDQLHTVNLFKFYHNVFKTVFNIIKFHIKRNNEPYILTIDVKLILLMMISAYMDVYRSKFPDQQISEVTLDQINLKDFYNDDEYDEEVNCDETTNV